MKFIELAKNRYSCRNYESKTVEQEKLEMVLEAGRVAPSAKNLQPWRFVVIREPENLEKIYGVYHREWFRTAPCVILILGDHNRSWVRGSDGKDHCDVDISITVDHMTLQATELGLATCWICAFDPVKTTGILNLPSHLEPIVILPLGYPLDKSDPSRHGKKRKPLQEIVSYETL